MIKHMSQIHRSMLDRGTNLEGMEAPTSQQEGLVDQREDLIPLVEDAIIATQKGIQRIDV